MTFQPGDVVLLKSGGPRMTVHAVSDVQVSCVWFHEGIPTAQTQTFNPWVLQLDPEHEKQTKAKARHVGK